MSNETTWQEFSQKFAKTMEDNMNARGPLVFKVLTKDSETMIALDVPVNIPDTLEMSHL